ncbi:acyltransferase family protein [Stutzerimonas sp. R75]|uniref:acyltransferase family protein n=1 Tax=Stutzerimonas sp. R75 TaxID=3439498 RepID=UPI0037D5474D
MPAQPSPPRNLPAADGIRGLACLLVLLVHAFSHFYPATFPLTRGAGKYGVWLFFVLSSFLLTLRLQQRGFGLSSLADYALGRTLRVLPLYFLACLLYYWAGIGITTATELKAALTFQQGFIHLWTIPVEFKFYLLLPPLAWAGLWLLRRYGHATLTIGGLSLLLLQQVLWPYWQTPENSAETRWYLPAFLFGILAALLLQRLRQLPRARVATPYALATLLILLLALPGTRLWLFDTPPSMALMNKHLYLGLLWAIFLVLLVDGHGLAGRLLMSRPMAWLGAISYSTYLFHWLVFSLLARYWQGSLIAMLAAVILALLAGMLGYRLLEQPAEQFRHRLSRAIRKLIQREPAVR